ncbi:MAG: tetratricopeptide repeat protein [Bdellovibrionota bacterium]
MSFDKAKTIQLALKYTQQNKLDKAILEYQKLAKADPSDVNPRMKIAGFFVKLGQIPSALQAYQDAANIYVKKGFYNKAVAIYKQMLQVDPTFVEGYLRLAEVLQKMGLLGDAMAQYKTVVAYYDKEGQTFKALEILKKMVDLDPSNLATHVKLAEIYYRQSMPKEGGEQLYRVIADLTGQKRFDEAVKVYERLIRFDPENAQALKECYKLLLQLRRHEGALPYLQTYLRKAKDDLEAVRDVAIVFGAMGNTKNQKIAMKEYAKRLHAGGRDGEAQQVYEKILQIDPTDPTALAALGRDAPNAPEDAIIPEIERTSEVKVPSRPAVPAAPVFEEEDQMVIEEDETAPDFRTVGTGVEEVLVDEGSSAGESLGSLPGEEEAQGEITDNQAEEILIEAGVYVKYGLRGKAVAHLKRLALLRPDHSQGLSRLASLLIEEGQKVEAVEVLLRAGESNEKKGTPAFAKAAYEILLSIDPANAAAKAKLSALASKPAAAAPSAQAAISLDDVDAALAGTEPGVELAAPPKSAAAAFDLDLEEPVAPPAPKAAAAPAAPPPLDIEIPAEEPAASEEAPIPAPAASLEDEIAIDVDVGGEAPPPDEEPLAPPAPEETPPMAAAAEEPAAPPPPTSLEDEISVDMGESAAPPPPEEEPLAPPAPEPVAAPPPPAARTPFVPKAPAVTRPPLTTTPPKQPLAAKPAPSAPIASRDDFAEPSAPPPKPGLTTSRLPPPPSALKRTLPPPPSSFRAGLKTPPPPPPRTTIPPASSRIPPPPPLKAPAKAAPPPPAPKAGDPFLEQLDEAEFYMAQGLFDEARPLYQAILKKSPAHPIAKAKMAELEAGAAAQAKADKKVEGFATDQEGQVNFEDVFSEFKKGIDKNVAREDSATHYDLGIAYKEMGLLNDAIGEFVTALGGVGARKADCYNMIGIIHQERGEFDRAAEAFQLGLGVENANSAERMGLKFELAQTLAHLDRKGESLTLFEEIEAEDSGYRDVGEKIVELKGEGVEAAPLQELKAAQGGGKGRRVSYV